MDIGYARVVYNSSMKVGYELRVFKYKYMYGCCLSEICIPISFHRGPEFSFELLHNYIIFNCTLVDLNFCPDEEQLKL